MIRGLIALAFGALSFGVLEFVVMGLLPYISADFNVDIPTASYTISAYALGVCVGVLYMIFTRKLNLKLSIIIIIITSIIGTTMTALAPSFEVLLAARFITGLPHGCFFGVGAIISSRIANEGKSGVAMAIMLTGQTISNVFGVPLGTALAHSYSWRSIFYIFVIWGLIVLVALIKWLPDPGKLEDRGFLSQFEFLKSRGPYLIGLSILLGNGGLFCVQSYISPILTDFVGVSLALVPAILIAMGIAMTVYNFIAGTLCDRFTPGQVSSAIFISAIVAMALAFAFGNYTWFGVVILVYVAGCLFGLSTPQQISMLRSSYGGELIGVAFGQVAFNFGNAIGASLGAIPVEKGYSYDYVLIVAIALVCIGTSFVVGFMKFAEPKLIAKVKAHKQQRASGE